jgi:hypothetical protein
MVYSNEFEETISKQLKFSTEIQVTYEDIVEVLEACYRDHGLVTAHCSRLKGRTHLTK